MSKQAEIDAFDKFVETIQKISKKDGAYFNHLICHAEKIRQNIRNDFMPFIGVFVEQEVFDQVTDDYNKVRAEREQFDVRRINQRIADARAEIGAAEQQMRDAEKAHEEARDRIAELEKTMAATFSEEG